jgi:RNA polymerase sigma-32 factor
MPDAYLPDDIAEDAIDTDRRSRWLSDALAVLNERELRIVREHRLSESVVTLESLAERLGISKERVRQIEFRALGKMRVVLTRMRDNVLPVEDARKQKNRVSC